MLRSIAVALFLLPQLAAAATFTATRADDPLPDTCLPADCSLREAVLAAEATPEPDVIALPAGTAKTVILHGHYRDWYAPQPRAARVHGRLGTFGGVRRYKGVAGFVDAYADAVAQDPTLSMTIGGKASTPELAADLRSRVGGLPAVELRLEFLSDAELVELVTASELVVLAYQTGLVTPGWSA